MAQRGVFGNSTHSAMLENKVDYVERLARTGGCPKSLSWSGGWGNMTGFAVQRKVRASRIGGRALRPCEGATGLGEDGRWQ